MNQAKTNETQTTSQGTYAEPARSKRGWRAAAGGSLMATVLGFALCNGAVLLAGLGLGSAGLLSALHSTAPILWGGAVVFLVLAGALWLRSRRNRVLEHTNLH